MSAKPRSLIVLDADVKTAFSREPQPPGRVRAGVVVDVRESPGGARWQIAQRSTPRPSDPAGDAVRAHLAKHVRRFLQQDARMRCDQPDAVHQMRVAARTLRSGLQVFGPLIDRLWARQLRTELGWAADQLGLVRDTEVLMRRLTDNAQQLPVLQGELAIGAVDRVLQSRMVDAHSQALEQLSTPRQHALIDALLAGVDQPPLTAQARNTCRDVLPPLVEQSWDNLARTVKHLHPASPAPAWHQARIAAKKTRYTAEAVAPIFGHRMTKFAAATAAVTDLLGDQNDADVAQHALAALADTAGVDGPTGYALGLLSAYEYHEELRLRAAFGELWPTVAKAHRHAKITSQLTG